MKNWENNSKGDWHNTQYTDVIEKVVIQDGIVSIGRYAFNKCVNLKNVDIPQSVKSIKQNAFLNVAV